MTTLSSSSSGSEGPDRNAHAGGIGTCVTSPSALTIPWEENGP